MNDQIEKHTGLGLFDGVGSGCPNCGSTSLHACTGGPMQEWTEEERLQCYEAVRSILKMEKPGNTF